MHIFVVFAIRNLSIDARLQSIARQRHARIVAAKETEHISRLPTFGKIQIITKDNKWKN